MRGVRAPDDPTGSPVPIRIPTPVATIRPSHAASWPREYPTQPGDCCTQPGDCCELSSSHGGGPSLPPMWPVDPAVAGPHDRGRIGALLDRNLRILRQGHRRDHHAGVRRLGKPGPRRSLPTGPDRLTGGPGEGGDGYPAGTFQPRDSAISRQVGQSGYRLGLRPGTQILPHRALTAVPLTMPSTTDGPAGM